MTSAPQNDINRAAKLHQGGNLAEAEAIYRAILASSPRHFDANHLLGVIYLQQGNAELAAKQISVALQISPKNAAALSNLGNALSDLRRLDEALASYDKALALQPDLANAHVNRVNALKGLRRIPEAIASYDKAIALQPNHQSFMNPLAATSAKISYGMARPIPA